MKIPGCRTGSARDARMDISNPLTAVIPIDVEQAWFLLLRET